MIEKAYYRLLYILFGMSNFILWKDGADISNTSDDIMDFYLYPNRSKVDEHCENAFANALDDLGQQALNLEACWKYRVYISYEHPSLDASSKDAFWDGWVDYSIDQKDGCHIAATEAEIGGRAFSPTDEGSFVKPVKAIVGYTNPKELSKNIIIQESLHTYVNRLNVQDMVNTSSSHPTKHEEHDLGMVYGDGSVSPMATGYVSEHDDHGTCSPNNWYLNTYKTRMTDCTKTGLKRTSNDA